LCFIAKQKGNFESPFSDIAELKTSLLRHLLTLWSLKGKQHSQLRQNIGLIFTCCKGLAEFHNTVGLAGSACKILESFRLTLQINQDLLSILLFKNLLFHLV
jgi:hypothetical protein